MSVSRTKGSARKASKAGAGRARVSAKNSGPLLQQPLERRRWLRALAYVIGALVLMAHVYNFPSPKLIRNMFPIDIRDVIYHSSMFATFTLAFRFSLADMREYPAKWLRPADATALLVCCGWGALCETLQIWIPGREFHYNELALNTSVPLIVIALVSLARRKQ